MRFPKLPPNYFFVPFGRTAGGLFEKLALPPTATAEEVSSRYSRYLTRLEDEYQKERLFPQTQVAYAQLVKRREDKKITGQEFIAELQRLIEGLVDPETKAALDLISARDKVEKGQLNEQRFNNRLEGIAMNIGYTDLHAEFQAGKISKEEREAGLQAIIERLDQIIDAGIDIKEKREAIIAKLRQHPLTQEEFNALDTAWKEDKTQSEIEINTLKAQWETRLALKREVEKMGFVYNDTIWFDDTEDRQRTLSSPQSLVRAADAMWARVTGTGRSWWQSVHKRWLAEFQRLGPAFDIDQLKSDAGLTPSTQPLIPSLCQPTTLVIEELLQEEMEDLSQLPKRMTQARPLDIDALFAALLQEKMAPESTGEGRRPKSEEQKGEKAFLRFLEALAKAKHEGTDNHLDEDKK